MFADSTFAGDVDDLIAAGQAMTAGGKEPALLVGLSLGGAAVLMTGGAMPHVRAIATIAAPFDVAHILNLFAPSAIKGIEANFAGTTNWLTEATP
jgi:putative redox protein